MKPKPNRFPYRWEKAKAYPKGRALKVFSTFACGGGSTMGYKLAGFDVVGANDIDPQMAKVYRHNHSPRHYVLAPVKDLATMDLPDELFELDVLDGSPPCSTFSLAGAREANWGKGKKFREGQAHQVLDDLFFDFIAVAKRLQPKVVVAENVKGMLAGNAKGYLVQIDRAFREAGYVPQLFCLNAATMGVPQKRERVFFVCQRADLKLPPIKLEFDGAPILPLEVADQCDEPLGKPLSDAYRVWWEKMGSLSGLFAQVHPKGSFFNTSKVSPWRVLSTITATSGAKLTHWSEPRELSSEFLALANSFPVDYDYLDVDPKYLIGMSVPPVMVAQVANQIREQWLKR